MADGDRTRLYHQPRGPQPAQGALRDDVVEEHGVDATRHQVRVGVHVVVVRHGDEADRIPGGDEDIVCHRGAERRHPPAAQPGEVGPAAPVAGPHGQHLAELEVGDGDGVAGAARRGVLHAREADSEITPLDGLIDRGPQHLHEACAPAQPARERFRYLDVEATDLGRVGGVGFDEGRAALGVAAPPERRVRLLRCAEPRRNAERRGERGYHGFRGTGAAMLK